MHLHHIQGGVARVHAEFNIILLCERCHFAHHDRLAGVPELSKGHILWAKREEDPDSYSPKKLAALTHRKSLPYKPTPLPDFFMSARSRMGADLWT